MQINDYYLHLNLNKFNVTLDALIQESHNKKFVPTNLKNSNTTFFENQIDWSQAYISDLSELPNIFNIAKKMETVMGVKYINNNILDTEKLAIRYFKQTANTDLPYHKDSPGAENGINFLLTHDDASPFTFKDIGDVFYTCALFNTSKTHMVRASSKDRLILRVTPMNVPFNELAKRLINHDMNIKELKKQV